MNKKFESTRVDDKQRVRIHKKRKMFLKKNFFQMSVRQKVFISKTEKKQS